ncbi:TPA: hypothetical protein ACIVWC_004875, partial [Salmonella enterica subsp. diarizonae serovar 61:l,v:z35]
MLGFVSALSAALAIIVLIASVMLVNLLSLSIEKSNQHFQIKFSGIDEGKSENNIMDGAEEVGNYKVEGDTD